MRRIVSIFLHHEVFVGNHVLMSNLMILQPSAGKLTKENRILDGNTRRALNSSPLIQPEEGLPLPIVMHRSRQLLPADIDKLPRTVLEGFHITPPRLLNTNIVTQEGSKHSIHDHHMQVDQGHVGKQQ
jgi:hypothetical protein